MTDAWWHGRGSVVAGLVVLAAITAGGLGSAFASSAHRVAARHRTASAVRPHHLRAPTDSFGVLAQPAASTKAVLIALRERTLPRFDVAGEDLTRVHLIRATRQGYDAWLVPARGLLCAAFTSRAAGVRGRGACFPSNLSKDGALVTGHASRGRWWAAGVVSNLGARVTVVTMSGRRRTTAVRSNVFFVVVRGSVSEVRFWRAGGGTLATLSTSRGPSG
jgi:hypothetical protein